MCKLTKKRGEQLWKVQNISVNNVRIVDKVKKKNYDENVSKFLY